MYRSRNKLIIARSMWSARGNSVLRDILERIVDSESIFNVNDFDQAVDSVIFALNSVPT